MKKSILLLASLISGLCAFVAKSEKLNVLFVISDDQGYGDLSCNGNPYLKTPNLDRLATESYRLTNYHTGTTCAPTRSGLMTGKYCNSVGVWHTIMGRYILDKNEKTVAQTFKENGYATALFGKWHLGDNYPYRPFDRGFETVFWFKGGAMGQTPDTWGNNYFDSLYYRGNKPERKEGYSTEVFVDEAIAYMQEQQSADKPFFCYLALNAAHFPYNVSEKYSAQFKDMEGVPNADFYGMIVNIDENIGRINKFLKDSGLAENTIFIYTTDNGSSYGTTIDKKTKKVIGYSAGMRDKKASVYEGGHRVPFFMRIPSKKGADVSQLLGYIDVVPTLQELCGIENAEGMDGISMVEFLEDTSKTSDRYLVVDTQRSELMSKDDASVVMKNSLRLVNRAELYDVSVDIGQENDIAKDYPEVVAEMLKVHDEYWDYVAPQNEEMKDIPLESPTEDFVMLNTHDRHISCFWDQNLQIRGGRKTKPEGFWYVSVPEDGVYSFEMYRWAPDTALNLKDTCPAIPAIKGTSVVAQKEGVAFKDISGAELIIGDVVSETKSIAKRDNPQSINFEGVKLKKGEYKLFANFNLAKGKMGVHYIKVVKQ